MRTIISGVKATGEFTHLGNYFGAIKPWCDLQNENTSDQNLYFIANYHSLTTERDGDRLRKNTWNIVREYIAYGLDPEKSIIFLQSDVPEVTELTWIFNCLTPIGLLERAHAYKDAIAKGKEANVGLFDYPVLMAADILLYQSSHVPVGRDQKQHVEIARDIAEKFNYYYGQTFILPEPIIKTEVEIIPGIDGEKMSKSYNNTIHPFEEEKNIRQKIMSLKTDSKGIDEPKELAGNLIFTYLQLVGSHETIEKVKDKFIHGGIGYGEAKKILVEEMLNYFGPMRKKYESLDELELRKILQQGSAKAKQLAHTTMTQVRTKVGII